ncbi:MAG: hypothetical protein QE263_02740 [Vampirovibrionales bacterium]|nr:hypothetical protein [Vampirovibrionales bacterium]
MRDFIDTPLHRGKGVAVYGGTQMQDLETVKSWTKTFAQNGYHIVTGGGPGVMKAAQQGAVEGGSVAIGTGINWAQWNIKDGIQNENGFVKDYQRFVDGRTVTERFENPNGFYGAAACQLVFPGGFGTKAEMYRMVYDLMANATRYPIQRKLVVADLDPEFTAWVKSQFTSDKSTYNAAQYLTFVKTPEEALDVFKSTEIEKTRAVKNVWMA